MLIVTMPVDTSIVRNIDAASPGDELQASETGSAFAVTARLIDRAAVTAAADIDFIVSPQPSRRG
jgi:hypothetical protein